MKLDGYSIRFREEVMGTHSPLWENGQIFERYYNLMEKFKKFHYIWTETIPSKLVKKIQADPSLQNIYALSGAMSSIFSDKNMEGEKDFRMKRKEFGRLKGFLTEPTGITLYPADTRSCNFKCTFCRREHGVIEQAPDMPLKIVETVLYKFPKVKSVCCCGFSEPLMSTTLMPIIQMLKKDNRYVGLITNGSLLPAKFKELNGSYRPDYISVSMNAPNAQGHEQVTGTKTWDAVMEGIRLVVNSPIECFISAVVSLENIASIPDLVRLAYKLGVKTVHLHNLLPHCTDSLDNEYFWNNVLQKQHAPLIEQLKQLPEAGIVKGWPVLIDRNGGNGRCHFPWYSFSVNGLGNLSFCNSVLPCNKIYGNINDHVMWNSDAAIKFRDDYCDQKLVHCKMCFRNW
jgi:MoaA/NifB/PqqE/SkfB family radical SAM enzyme